MSKFVRAPPLTVFTNHFILFSRFQLPANLHSWPPNLQIQPKNFSWTHTHSGLSLLFSDSLNSVSTELTLSTPHTHTHIHTPSSCTQRRYHSPSGCQRRKLVVNLDSSLSLTPSNQLQFQLMSPPHCSLLSIPMPLPCFRHSPASIWIMAPAPWLLLVFPFPIHSPNITPIIF